MPREPRWDTYRRFLNQATAKLETLLENLEKDAVDKRLLPDDRAYIRQILRRVEKAYGTLEAIETSIVRRYV